MIKTLTAPMKCNYLGEWMTELPVNCVLKKGVTGCGATSLAIEQKGCTILAVPFVGLIQNKQIKYKDDLCGIHGEGDKTDELAAYLERHPVYKIAVTYDSFPKLVKTLISLGRDPYHEAFLAVDEWHIMCTNYSFRYKAIRGLLDEAQHFERVTYISATPIERKYWLDEVRSMDEVIIEWPRAERLHLVYRATDNPLVFMAKACRNRILDGGDTNYYVFLNSVEDINKIIVGAEVLTQDNTRIICSTSSKDKLLPGFFIGNASDTLNNPKPVNFLTSTCFEGQDIYDPIGEPIIVCDGWKKHTMVDISTSLIQIAGRIRKSQYSNRVTQILSLSNYQVVMTAEEYERDVMLELAREQIHVDWMNSCPEDLIDSFLKQIPYMRTPYVQLRGREIILDKGLAYQDIVNYKIVHLDYSSCVNMERELNRNGVIIDDSISVHDAGILKAMPATKRATFKEMFIRYCEIMESGQYSLVENEDLVEIRTKRPLVIEAYNKLGPDKVKAMKYHIGNIRNALTQMTNAKEDYKIVEIVSRALPMMQWIPVKKAKEALQEAHKVIGKKGSVTASDLEKWFDIELGLKYIDGKNQRSIIVKRPKLIRVFPDN